jgi:predicted esterase
MMIMAHGRGGSPRDMLALSLELDRPRLACLAPTAAGGSWYPYSFLEPIERNAGPLNSALRLMQTALEKAEAAGFPAERVVLLGFSQGACLALEFAARNARRYGGIIGLSGGLIGPEGTPRDYPGSFDGTPVFLGCGDRDAHVPKRRVDETASVLERMGAAVTERIYQGMGHTVSADEITAVRDLLDRFLAKAGPTALA